MFFCEYNRFDSTIIHVSSEKNITPRVIEAMQMIKATSPLRDKREMDEKKKNEKKTFMV